MFISEMKTTIFYTVTFLAFLLANSSVAMSKFISSVNWCSVDSMARFPHSGVASSKIWGEPKCLILGE